MRARAAASRELHAVALGGDRGELLFEQRVGALAFRRGAAAAARRGRRNLRVSAWPRVTPAARRSSASSARRGRRTIVGGAATMRAVGARPVFMPARLNGKQEVARRHGMPPTCAAPATVSGRDALRVAALAQFSHWAARASGKVARVAPPARIPANERLRPRAAAMSHAPAGKRVAAPRSGCSHS